jgi:transglutaminase-like putative cysteine protease
VIYDLRHLTTYRYQAPVSFTRCALRLSPADTASQHLLKNEIQITPPPATTAGRTGAFGERVLAVTVETPHRELKIEARSRVSVTRRILPDDQGSPAWERVRDAACAARSLDFASPAHFLFPTPMTPLLDAFTNYGRDCFAGGAPILAAAKSLSERIHRDFAYDPKATVVTTPAIKAFAARRGVCQDFAHIMIAALRGLGLPTAYVSGYLRTTPPPGKPRLQGADATHAWISLWCGEDLGWIDFDPTNALVVGDEHIELAVGRDYADVAPIDGVILGGGEQAVSVAVDVVPVESPRAA